jgi:hypothetical protein
MWMLAEVKMRDIVERLTDPMMPQHGVWREAAAEILRLRKRNEKLHNEVAHLRGIVEFDLKALAKPYDAVIWDKEDV